jgi:hypothetical protein
MPVVAIFLLLCLVCVGSTSAQSGFTAVITPPDTSQFPRLTAYLDVHDPSGGFVHALTPQDVSMQEDGISLPVTDLEQQIPGVQFVIAITPGASFNIRDSMGTSRYEYLLQQLLSGTWTNQPPGVDDFSLLTMGGPQLTHSSNPASLLTALKGYVPGEQDVVPNLEVLAAALQVALDPTARPGMERAILFITPPQGTEVSLGLQSIIASAGQQNVHIFVWILAAPEIFTSPEVDQLRSLANQTTGAFFTFSHDEPVPDLEYLLEPLRYVYQLSYASQITTPGTHQVVAQVNTASGMITTLQQSFELDLQSPDPTLLDVPDEIVRTFAAQPTPGTSAISADLQPEEQVLTITVSYPDGYDHSLSITRLYVDGAVAAENSQAPFDKFVWDLRQYTQTGVHTLMVEAIDDMNLVGKSDSTSVRIIVPSAAQGIFISISEKKPLLLGAAIIVSVSMLVLVLILGGHIRPKPHPGQVRNSVRGSEKTHPASPRSNIDLHESQVSGPVKTAGVTLVPVRNRLNGWLDHLPWFRHEEERVPVIAYLIPLVGFDEPTLPAPLPITAQDISLGGDPHLASLVIINPSIEGLHARIYRQDKKFLISDAGTVAGTWVNYEQVVSPGTALQHMDIIHLGRIGFRFQLSEPGQSRKVTITPLEADR